MEIPVKYFELAEFDCSFTGNNEMKPEFLEKLDQLRHNCGFPFVVTSGYRSPEVNAAIGGSATSAHCKGFAADFEVLGMDNKELALWIRDNLKFTQLILEFYKEGIPDSGWVHCAFDRNDLKEQVLTATKVDGKTKYLVGIQ